MKRFDAIIWNTHRTVILDITGEDDLRDLSLPKPVFDIDQFHRSSLVPAFDIELEFITGCCPGE